jgi:hypothetical protein
VWHTVVVVTVQLPGSKPMLIELLPAELGMVVAVTLGLPVTEEEFDMGTLVVEVTVAPAPMLLLDMGTEVVAASGEMVTP